MKRQIKIFCALVLIPAIISCGGGEKQKPVDDEKDTTIKTNDVPVDPNAGMSEGMNEIKYPSGQLKMKGEIVQGERHGLWTSYYENGLKWSEDSYNLGARDGKCVSFYGNGQVRYIGYYTNNVKSGKWDFFDEQGNLTKSENFSDQ